MIDKISKSLQLSNHKEQTVLEMHASEDENVKTLRLKRGSWKSKKEPWLVIDDNQKVHALISMDAMHKIVENFKQMEQDAFALKLEKSILQQLPIDFQDVWTVAMKEVQKSKKTEINFDRLIKKIKQEHPNLFLNLKDFYMPEGITMMQSFESE
ncbi:MAG: DUF2603 domain-containing protein [Sulfurospirillaceae bacterium]|nr:DUF2603 domain-containing protein [Sulfurospirillaceae bacterium]